MREIDQAELVEGVGIAEDRYGKQEGTFSKKGNKVRHLTIISREAFLHANADSYGVGLSDAKKFTFADSRRNIVVGVSIHELNRLVGKQFKLGNAVVKGTELCIPCTHPSKLSGKPDFKARFQNAGGIRVEVVHGGLLKPSWKLIANIQKAGV